jgi:hypothetical protein
MVNSAEAIRQKIRDYQFFSNHPYYVVSSEYVTEKNEMLFIETTCQIMSPEILKLKRWIPKVLRERFFNVNINLAMNFEKLNAALETKSSHSDFYQSNIIIDLEDDLSIKNIHIDIKINSALEIFAKPVKKHLENIVRNTIYQDYQLVLNRLVNK